MFKSVIVLLASVYASPIAQSVSSLAVSGLAQDVNKIQTDFTTLTTDLSNIQGASTADNNRLNDIKQNLSNINNQINSLNRLVSQGNAGNSLAVARAAQNIKDSLCGVCRSVDKVNGAAANDATKLSSVGQNDCRQLNDDFRRMIDDIANGVN
ncbi:hypothetical protein HDV06_003592 [Boothiomyces sp. JEL0866]|nr:hypothetical protein HDV06_003592 [Boothiomyces sp. JEL0866]